MRSIVADMSRAQIGRDLKIQELYGWPRLSEPGRFLIDCSCGQWSYVGTAREINGASRGHDDSPGRNHIVKIRGLVIE